MRGIDLFDNRKYKQLILVMPPIMNMLITIRHVHNLNQHQALTPDMQYS